MNQPHDTRRQCKVETLQVNVRHCIARIVPCRVDVVPFSVKLHAGPYMRVSIAVDTPRFDTNSVQETYIGIVIGLAVSKPTTENALGTYVRVRIVILRIVDNPVVKPQGLRIITCIALFHALVVALRGNFIDDGVHRFEIGGFRNGEGHHKAGMVSSVIFLRIKHKPICARQIKRYFEIIPIAKVTRRSFRYIDDRRPRI